MKTAGIVIIVLGLLMIVYTGVTYVTRETVVDMGPLHVTTENEHTTNWPPYVGIGLMVVGGAVLFLGRKGSAAV